MKKFAAYLYVMVMLGFLVRPSYGMTDSQHRSCERIIHLSAVAAAGSAAALSQMPGVDNIALAGIIGEMVINLSDVFDVSLKHSAVELGKSVLKQFAGTIAARIATQWIVGWWPFIGNVVNAATMSGLVEYIGWEMADNFDTNRWYWLR